MGIFKTTWNFVKRNSGIILSGISALGTVGACVLSAKERPKADAKMEAFREKNPDATKFRVALEGAREYAWAGAVCTLTVASIFANYKITVRQKAELAAGAIAIYGEYGKYRANAAKKYGFEEDAELAKDAIDIPKDLPLKLYDARTGKFFYKYEAEIWLAFLELNERFASNGMAYENEFRDILGLETLPSLKDNYWDCADEVYFIFGNIVLSKTMSTKSETVYEIKVFNGFYKDDEDAFNEEIQTITEKKDVMIE